MIRPFRRGEVLLFVGVDFEMVAFSVACHVALRNRGSSF